MKMQFATYIFIFFVFLSLTSCVVEEGPLIVNRSGEELYFVAIFEDFEGRSGGPLPDNTHVWLGYEDSRLKSLKISLAENELLKFDIPHSVILDFYTEPSVDLLIILVLKDRYEIISRDEFKNLLINKNKNVPTNP